MIFILQMILKENVWSSGKGKDKKGRFLSLLLPFCCSLVLRHTQSEIFCEDHSYLFEKQNADLLWLFFRWCHQFLCYQVLHVGCERLGEVWFIMPPFGAFTTVIFYNLLSNLVLHDARGVLGDKWGKHSFPTMIANCSLWSALRKKVV